MPRRSITSSLTHSVNNPTTGCGVAPSSVEPASSIPPVSLYLDWGRYDLRSPLDGNDMGISSETFARRLHERGYTFVGGEVNDGAGWASWKNRTDRVFEALFPLAD